MWVAFSTLRISLWAMMIPWASLTDTIRISSCFIMSWMAARIELSSLREFSPAAAWASAWAKHIMRFSASFIKRFLMDITDRTPSPNARRTVRNVLKMMNFILMLMLSPDDGRVAEDRVGDGRPDLPGRLEVDRHGDLCGTRQTFPGTLPVEALPR